MYCDMKELKFVSWEESGFCVGWDLLRFREGGDFREFLGKFEYKV